MVQEGQNFLWPGGTRNLEVSIEEIGEGEPTEGFGSKMAEGRVKLNRNLPGYDGETYPGNIVETDELRASIDPRDVQMRRSDAAREADSAKDAPLTTDPLTWASAPSQYDYPGVDTGPTFEEKEGDFDTGSFLDNMF